MKRQLSNIICGLKFARGKNNFERIKSFSGKKRNDFVANPIIADCIDKIDPNYNCQLHTLFYIFYELMSNLILMRKMNE